MSASGLGAFDHRGRGPRLVLATRPLPATLIDSRLGITRIKTYLLHYLI